MGISVKCTTIVLALVGGVWSTNVDAGTPVVTYGTYFGGSGDEKGSVVACDSAGNILIGGTTTSSDLKGTAAGYQPRKAPGFPGNSDLFVAKLDPTARTLLWATYLGGDGDDALSAMVVDASDNVYLVGTTASMNFPFTPTAYRRGAGTFAAKLSPDGGKLIYSTSLPVNPASLAVNAAGEAYVAGTVGSGFTTTSGALNAAGSSVALLKLNATGSGLLFAALLGGGQKFPGSSPSSLAVDQQGNAYVAGRTTGDMLTTGSALQPAYSNSGLSPPSSGALDNGFILKVNSSGTQLLWGTYFGPRYASTSITDLAVSLDGAVYFGGMTNADSLAATTGAFQSSPGAGYIARLRSDGTALDSFSYLPGSLLALRLGVDALHCIVTLEPFSWGFRGNDTVFKRYFWIGERSLSLLGRADLFDAQQLAIAASNAVWIVGRTYRTANYGGFFLTPDALQPSLLGPSDSFLAGITPINPAVMSAKSAASLLGTAFSPGQLISVFGLQLGPTQGVGATVDKNNVVGSSVSEVRALFDGIPAPLLFVRADQVNTVIPFATAGRRSTQLVIEYKGAASSPIELDLQDAAPGIFTMNGTGGGQAAAYNQDVSLNSPLNPAARGSVISFYVTGAGSMSPPVAYDGQILGSTLPSPVLPVIVGLGNRGIDILYAGATPGCVAGVVQVNVKVPDDALVGLAVPLVVKVGNAFSPPGVTIAIK